MEAIDKLLYNLLSSGRSVVLPEVGTLRVEQSATTQSGNRVTCGTRRVRFSSRADKNVLTLVAVMVKEYGLEEREAAEAYGEWLRVARKGSEVNIEGVGCVRKGFFTPAESFENEALNPWNPSPVTLRRRPSSAGWIVAALLAVGAVGAWWWLEGGEQYAKVAQEKMDENAEQEAAEETIVASLEEYAEELENAKEAEKEIVEEKPKVAEVAQPAPTPAPKPTPAPAETAKPQSARVVNVPAASIPVQPAERTSGKSVVVAGVFSTNENADKFIAEDELGVGSSAYSKHPYGSKILVAVGGIFDNSAAANTHRRTLPATSGSLWVYTFK